MSRTMEARSQMHRERAGDVTRAVPPSFVGREAELGRVRRLLAGSPVLVAIGGEPGMGKSRLMEEALAAVPPREVLVAACSPFPEPYTLAPIVDALSRRLGADERVDVTPLGGALRPLFPEWADWLPAAPAPSGSTATDRHRLLRATAEVIDALGVRVLALDDAHLADQATIELVQLLFSRVGGTAISVVMTHRTQEVPPDTALPRLVRQLPSSARHIPLTLQPLSEIETARLLAALTVRWRVSPAVAAFVQERTGGLPLAVIELVRYLDEQPGPSLAAAMEDLARQSPDAIPLPPTLSASVLDRVGRLPDAARICVRAAAIVGEPATEWALAEVAGLPLDEVVAGLSDAMQRGLLREHSNHRISMAHPIMAQVVYDAIPAPTRRALHKRAARLLQNSVGTSTSLIRAAHHLRRAGLLDEWMELAPLAAETARAASDEATANSLYLDLVTSTRSKPADVAALAHLITFNYVARPRVFRSMIDALRRCIALTTEPSTRGSLLFQLGRVLTFNNDRADARAAFGQALPYLSHNPTDKARALTQLAQLDLSDRTRDERLTLLSQAAECAHSAPSDIQATLAIERAFMLRQLGDEGGWDIDVAAIVGPGPWSAQTRAELAREQANRAWAGVIWGRYSASRSALVRARKLIEAGVPQLSDAVAQTEQHLDWMTGDWTGLADRIETLAGSLEADPTQHSSALLTRGLLKAATDSGSDEPSDDLTAVAEESAERGDLERLLIALGALARLAADEGRPADAVTCCSDVVEALAARGFWLWLADVGVTYVAALCSMEAVTDAEDLVQRWTAGARGLAAPSVQICLLSAQAHVLAAHGSHATAAELFKEASRKWATLPRPLEAHRAQVEAGVALIAAGERDGGHRLLADGLRALLDLGANGEARRIYRRAVRAGITPRTHPYRSGRRGYGVALSPSELDVIRLVATGRSNREIAETLSRSPKTVYSQLRSAMSKLGAETRVDAALKAIDAGLASKR